MKHFDGGGVMKGINVGLTDDDDDDCPAAPPRSLLLLLLLGIGIGLWRMGIVPALLRGVVVVKTLATIGGVTACEDVVVPSTTVVGDADDDDAGDGDDDDDDDDDKAASTNVINGFFFAEAGEGPRRLGRDVIVVEANVGCFMVGNDIKMMVDRVSSWVLYEKVFLVNSRSSCILLNLALSLRCERWLCTVPCVRFAKSNVDDRIEFVVAVVVTIYGYSSCCSAKYKRSPGSQHLVSFRDVPFAGTVQHT